MQTLTLRLIAEVVFHCICGICSWSKLISSLKSYLKSRSTYTLSHELSTASLYYFL